LILDPEEFTLLTRDRSLFFAELDGKNPGSIQWEPSHDFYVVMPFAVVGQDLQSVIVETMIYVVFEDSTKGIIIFDQKSL